MNVSALDQAAVVPYFAAIMGIGFAMKRRAALVPPPARVVGEPPATREPDAALTQIAS